MQKQLDHAAEGLGCLIDVLLVTGTLGLIILIVWLIAEWVR